MSRLMAPLMSESAYRPFMPARHPTSTPRVRPKYRLLVHRKFARHWDQLVQRIGEQGALQFWEHVTENPGSTSAVAQTTILKGKAGKAMGPGWSKTCHYEISGAGRIDYQYHNAYRTKPEGDPHRVVAIRTISFSSH